MSDGRPSVRLDDPKAPAYSEDAGCFHSGGAGGAGGNTAQGLSILRSGRPLEMFLEGRHAASCDILKHTQQEGSDITATTLCKDL